MILWTVIPMEIVLRGVSDEQQPQYEELEYGNARLMVEKTGPSQYRVVRVISTDPTDYLRPEIQPGSKVVFQPVFGAP
jgi:hypothetical protein